MAKLFRAAIMGPPGSGKGTISKRIAENFGLQYLSCGHFLRESAAANTGRIGYTLQGFRAAFMSTQGQEGKKHTQFSADSELGILTHLLYIV